MKIRGRLLVVCLGLLGISAARGQQYTIQTLAGNGSAGFAGDNGDPAAAQLNSPNAVALDSKGNLYIADTVNQRIRMISGRTITTVAGNQAQGPNFGGDLGAATVANLWSPTAIAFDAAGNYYIADNGNSRIRKVDTAGIITTFVGASGGTSGTAGKLDHPNGLVFDAGGALYIADSNNARVARYVPPSDFTNIAGTGTAFFSGDGGQANRAQLNKPAGIAMDAAGNIYLADTNNSRIRKITTDGIITTIAGSRYTGYSGDGGDATAAWLNFPRSVAVSPNGTVYIADTGNHAIRVLTPTFPAITSNGIGNAASYTPRISPGALASIFGSGFGTGTFQADDGSKWPTNANSVSVQVNGVAAPLYYVSPVQINFQVPWSTPTTGTVNIAVTVNGGRSNVAAVPVATAAPGLFVLQSGQAAVLNPDYSINDPSNPVKAGATIFAYLTGSGPVSPPAQDGVPASTTSLVYVQASNSATVGNQPATVSFAGLAPGFIGLVQMNIVVPTSLAPGTYPLSVTIDGQTSNAAPITVK